MILKTIQDYYEEILNLYPNISLLDIKRILLYGWKSLYLHNSYGGDVLLSQQGFWFYTGTLMNNSLHYFNYYKRKLRTKLRVLYKRKHIQWDGYYYFALSENQFNEYLKLKNKKGRPRKNFKFNNIILYKLFDECNIIESGKKAIFKVSMPIEFGFTLYKPEFTTSNFELLLTRDPLTFKDILVSNYNYLFLHK